MTIVLCHGTFDCVHSGHIEHLRAARAFGDRLVVSVTGDAWVRKGPGRPYFSAADRKAHLEALRCVDEVIITECRNATEAIQRIQPATLIKGLDWQDKLDDPDLKADTAAMLAIGGTVEFVGPTLASSSALINHALKPLDAPLRDFLDTIGLTGHQLREAVERFSTLKVVVIGDAIHDHYHTVYPLGLTAKASAISLRHVVSEIHQGGVLAIKRHLEQFTTQVRAVALANGVTVKERWVSAPSGDQPLTKYFAMLREQESPTPAQFDAYGLRDSIHWADLVVVGDFGHGAMSQSVRKLVQDEARFLAVNCQTNSANYGFNILPSKYWRCDLFSLDRTEIALAAGEQKPEPVSTLGTLRRQLDAKAAFLTQGDVDTIAFGNGERLGNDLIVRCPALNAAPVDTLGAGDAFFAVVALAGAAQLPLPVCTLLGQLAGYQAVQIVGNREPVSKSKLLEHATQLLAK